MATRVADVEAHCGRYRAEIESVLNEIAPYQSQWLGEQLGEEARLPPRGPRQPGCVPNDNRERERLRDVCSKIIIILVLLR